MVGVLLFGERVVIPRGLRQEVLGTLNSGHQGVSSMAGRAGQSVWWPNISGDLVETRERCQECHRNTPSQQPEPPVALPEVRYPFQMMCGDYFALQGYTYLVLVNRYSGWPVVHQAKQGSTQELIRVLKEVCVTYGILGLLKRKLNSWN